MTYNKEPIKNLVGDTILPLTIFEQVKVSETNNKNLKQVLEEEMAEKTHNHDDSYYTKQEVDEKEQNLIETVEEITDEVYTKTEVDKKIESVGNFDANLYYDKTATDSLLANKADTSSLDGKVDKVEGKSLVDDSEIARLATVTNYDDTEVKNQIATKANSADVYTKTEIDNMIGTISSTLDTLNGEVV